MRFVISVFFYFFFSFSSCPIPRILHISSEDYLPKMFNSFPAGTIQLQSRGVLSGCQWPAMALSRSLGASIAGTCGVSSEPEAQSGGFLLIDPNLNYLQLILLYFAMLDVTVFFVAGTELQSQSPSQKPELQGSSTSCAENVMVAAARWHLSASPMVLTSF